VNLIIFNRTIGVRRRCVMRKIGILCLAATLAASVSAPALAMNTSTPKVEDPLKIPETHYWVCLVNERNEITYCVWQTDA
jgi:hypothetical protein